MAWSYPSQQYYAQKFLGSTEACVTIVCRTILWIDLQMLCYIENGNELLIVQCFAAKIVGGYEMPQLRRVIQDLFYIFQVLQNGVEPFTCVMICQYLRRTTGATLQLCGAIIIPK
jgi:hypothetical protein